MVFETRRRKVIGALGGMILLGACASAADEDDEENGGSDDNSQESDNGGDNGGDNEGEDDSSEESNSEDDSGGNDGPTYAIRVIYGGEWQGAMGSEGSTSSVSGEGEETHEIEGEPSVISANAQKQDDSDDELVIQILENGDVVAEESTTAEYGMAQVTHSNF